MEEGYLIEEGTTEIREFPGYWVNRSGEIYSERRDLYLTPSRNNDGGLKVTLMKNGAPHTRILKNIVAKEFVRKPQWSGLYNYVVQKDGDILNVHASNLAWRPRWYGIKYQQQFGDGLLTLAHGPEVYEHRTGVVYPNAVEAAIGTGMMYLDVLDSIETGKGCRFVGYRFSEFGMKE